MNLNLRLAGMLYLLAITTACVPDRRPSGTSGPADADIYRGGTGDLQETFVEEEPPPLTEAEKTQRYQDSLLTAGWSDREPTVGDLPECYNFIPTKDRDMDNFLRINVGSGTDVVLKLMDRATEKCIRYVYINSGSTYSINNIPEGQYYLKIAYGRDWMSTGRNGQCVGRFTRDAMYELGDDLLDYHTRKVYDGVEVPSFELSLDVIKTELYNSFDSQNISEAEFNE